MRPIRVFIAGLMIGLFPALADAQILSGIVYDGSGGPLLAAQSPYTVPAFSAFTVPAGQTLTIEPGVEIRFMENAYGDVLGTLTANATPTQHIRLKTNTSGQYWFSLIVRSGGRANLSYCDIDSGGRNGNPMLLAQDAATLTMNQCTVGRSQGDGVTGNIGMSGPGSVSITDCAFTGNAGYGINLVRGPSGSVTLTNNTLTGNVRSAYHLGPDIYPSGGILSGNGFDGIDLAGGYTNVSGAYAHDLLVNASAPITVSAGRTLTLSPGILVLLRQEGTYIEVYGTLRAEGASASHIRFAPQLAGQYTQTLILRPGSTCSMRFCDVERGFVTLQDAADVTIDRSTFRLGPGDGLVANVGVSSGPSALTVTSCTFDRNTLNGVSLRRGPFGTVVLASNTFTSNGGSAYRLGPDIYPTGGLCGDNGFNGVDLTGGSVTVSGTYEHDLLFNAFAPVTVQAGRTLTLAPGVEARFMQGGTYLEVFGEVRAIGADSNFVRFMPHVPGQVWSALILRSGSKADLRYCDFTTGLTGMIVVQDATELKLDHSILRYCVGEGLSGFLGTSIPGRLEVTNSQFVNNVGTGLNARFGASATATLTCNRFTGNGGDGLALNGGAPVVSSNAFYNNTGAGFLNWGPTTIDVSNNWWGSPLGPFGPGGDSLAVTGSGSVIVATVAPSPDFPECSPVLDAGPRRVTAFTLRPCVPNPVRGLASIGFDLPRPAHVQLRVFDLQGRQVGVVADGWYAAGSSTLKFDAGQLQSGIYFYRMDAGGFHDTHRLVRVP